ncbi:XRE family transcriptional regulator [Ktedonosporobacter rubrisoli]|uniref:XRE family transcriptional regulator n=1 Tax=Ktedonosporobacter rubrisoli TaxID=2509675 RepID=A0A4P6K3Q4_KTERU|nr:helix-turn-helix transcriptional regulator [Ktedonosporobacter rubrisoli]QBD82592.1 XRE family transcriptional regulator [Ktedonosporobacter rubrisoli]
MIKVQQYETNLRELIEENGYTFKEISEETGISLSALFIYARGERSIPHESRYKIARVIGCSVTDVVSKRQLQKEVSKKIVTDDLLTELEDELANRWNLYHTVGAKYAYLGLDTKLQELDKLAQFAEGTRWSNQALMLLAMGYQLQSCVLRDMMDYKQSHIAYQKAFDVARMLEDQELMVSALAREGVTLIQQEKPQEAVIYLVGALNLLDDHGSLVLRGYILQGISEAYAKVARADESWRSIEQAEKYQTECVCIQERSLIRGVTTASIAAQKGVNAVLLREHQRAITLIDESLKTYDTSLTRGYARLLIQKAEASLGLETIDACVHHALEALSLAKGAGSSKTIARVQTLHNCLQQSHWRKEPSVIRLGMALKGNR